MPTRNFVANLVGNCAVLVTWTGLLNGDDGAPFEAADFDRDTLQATGTFGTGGSITMQGSNDGTNWVTLTDEANAALTFTAAGGDRAVQNFRFVRPIVTAGDGTTSLVTTALLLGWRR
jgi:hypothetical protein